MKLEMLTEYQQNFLENERNLKKLHIDLIKKLNIDF